MNPVDTAQVKADAAAREERPEKPPRKRRVSRWKSTTPGSQKGSREAKRTAAAILEVLAGVRTPTDAAEVVGVSSQRYYMLESRALQGLVGACERRPAGPHASPERELARLRREVDKLRSESARYQALARATQRTVGIAPPKPPKKGKDGKKRRRRKPVVRALKVAEALKGAAPPEAGGATVGAAASVKSDRPV